MRNSKLHNTFWSKDLIDKNRGRYFNIYRGMVSQGIWASLPLSSKKIFPIIGIHAANKTAFPSYRRIMKLSGYSKRNTFKEAIEGLKKHKLITVGIGKYGNPTYRVFKNKFNKEEIDSKYIPIKAEYLFNGTWAILPATAVAVYVVLGVFSNPIYFNSYMPEWLIDFAENVDDSFLNDDFFYNFRAVKLSLTEIENYSGVSRASVVKSIKILDEQFGLVKLPAQDREDFSLNLSNLYIIPLLHYFDDYGSLQKGYLNFEPEYLNTNDIYKIRSEKISIFNYNK